MIRNPVLEVLADHGRPGPGQALDRLQHARPAGLPRLATAAACLDVQVDTVLGCLGLRDLEERDARPKPLRVPDVSTIAPLLLRLAATAASLDVQVDTVLGCLGLRNLEERGLIKVVRDRETN